MDVNFLLAAVFILPGFVIERIRRDAKEYTNLTAFEHTISSLLYSIILIITSLLVFSYNNLKYNLFDLSLSEIIINYMKNKQLDILIEPIKYFSITYFIVFISIASFIYSAAWIDLIYRIKLLMKLQRRTKFPTPWDDYFHENSQKWMSVTLNDGRTILGKASITSHSPYEPELIISSEPGDPIKVYQNKQRINASIEYDDIYIPRDSIVSIESFEKPEKRRSKTISIGLIVLEILLMLTFILMISYVSQAFCEIILFDNAIKKLQILGIIVWGITIFLSIFILNLVDKYCE